MRTANFRDDILWPICYKIGLDPAKGLLSDQADALASYVNAWLRRTYDTADYPEWTHVRSFQPVDHIVAWSLVAVISPAGLALTEIARVFKVYLVDPNTTWMPVDTRFRLIDTGIHCGFEHGETVWIKFIGPCPRVTATPWNTSITYGKDEVTYSPRTGQCYKSKISGNLGHDPSVPPTLLNEIVQLPLPPNPGVNSTPKTVTVKFAPLVATPTSPVPDPPPAGMVFTINVYSSVVGISLTPMATATHTATGTESIATIMADLRAQLVADPDLATFTVTNDTPGITTTLQNTSDFGVTANYKTGSVELPLTVTQTAAYLPAVPPSAGQTQQNKVTVTDQTVIPNATYGVVIRDNNGDSHGFEYVALPTDGALQIINGLVAALQTAALDDPVLGTVTTSIDTTNKTVTFQATQSFGLDTNIVPAGSPYWDLVSLPLALVDQIVRGAYADAMKEAGQSDKGATEEAAVPTEAKAKIATQTTEPFDPLTDQQAPRSRYAVK